MSRVAEQMSAEMIARARRMTPEERVAESLALGWAAVDAYAVAHDVSRDEARRTLERAAQKGRRPSAVMDAIIG
jgi:hypothetical protein